MFRLGPNLHISRVSFSLAASWLSLAPTPTEHTCLSHVSAGRLSPRLSSLSTGTLESVIVIVPGKALPSYCGCGSYLPTQLYSSLPIFAFAYIPACFLYNFFGVVVACGVSFAVLPQPMPWNLFQDRIERITV